MSINTIYATMQIRQGLEENLNVNKLKVGEWTLSTDTKYVRICVANGIAIRMATYEAFEKDMELISQILLDCQSIQEAVERIQTEIGQTVEVVEGKAEEAKKAAEVVEQKAVEVNKSAERASVNALEAVNRAEAAAVSETNAKASETAAKLSEDNAKNSELSASESEKSAKEYADLANKSKVDADLYADDAENSKNTAIQKAEESLNYSNLSKSYAVGTNGEVRENDKTDNSEYYYMQCKRISQSLNGVIPMGTITFDELANIDNQQSGYMFNISDAFTSDDRFKDGGGISYGAGNNVLFTADEMWDVMAASAVSGVKGAAENIYRTGNINITPNDLGLGNVLNEKQYCASNPQESVSGSSGSCTGNSETATKLATARTIGGVSFDGSADISHYGICNTAAESANKVVDLTGFKLVVGATVRVKFTVTNTASNPTLNVNSTGAKAIYYRGSAISKEYLDANRTYEFTYNGTQWELVGDINTNTTYSNMTAATATEAGKAGLVPQPDAGKQSAYLRGDATFENVDDHTAVFSKAESRDNIASDEKHSVIFGKIMKWFADLKSHAFIAPVANLLTTVAGSALDATQGKVLDDKITELNDSLNHKIVKTGKVTNIEVPTGTNGINIEILFEEPLESVPNIFCALSQLGAYMSHGISNVTVNGFYITVVNNYTSELNISIDWIAVC